MEHIGSGASGVVWRAVDERLERSVAIKRIYTQAGLSGVELANVRQRAMREAKNAAQFQHPNAIVVFDIAEHNGDPCLIMEYLSSRSLSAVVAAEGALPLPQVAKIGEQVASALVAAHRAGIVHRDVKPGNVLLADNGVAKITDFGISRANGDHTLTETGMVVGTPAYLAPEIARGSDPTPASDVFALGATIYHVLEGRPPYGASTNQLALLYSAANAKLVPPRQSGNATELVLELLNAEPEKRPTMSEARARLARLVIASADTPPGLPAAPTLVEKPARAATAVLPAAAPAVAAERPPKPERSAPVEARAGSRNLKALLAGSAVGVVLLVALIALLMTNGSADTASSKSGQSSSSQSSADSRSSPPSGNSEAGPSPADLGHSKSSGTVVQWGSAGEVVSRFYSNPAGSWGLLTPAARQVYGSEQGLRQYWAQHPIAGFAGIDAYRGANNPDGSVDMRLSSLNAGGQNKQVFLRVVDSGAGLQIDGDTR